MAGSAWQKPVDDLPGFILAGFADVRRATGRYPRRLYVSGLLAEMMGAIVGIWGPLVWGPGNVSGIWGWVSFLDPAGARGRDEFGELE